MLGDITFPAYLAFLIGTWALSAMLALISVGAAPVAFTIGAISKLDASSRTRWEEARTATLLSFCSLWPFVYYTLRRNRRAALAEKIRGIGLAIITMWSVFNIVVLVVTTVLVFWIGVSGISGYLDRAIQGRGAEAAWFALDMMVSGVLSILALWIYGRLVRQQLASLRYSVVDDGSNLGTEVLSTYGAASLKLVVASSSVATLCAAVYFVGIIFVPVALSV